MNKIFERLKSIYFTKILKSSVKNRNPLTLLNSDINLILRNCTFNKNYLSDFELRFMDHILKQKKFTYTQINEKLKREIKSEEDHVDTKNFLILLKMRNLKFNTNREIIYNKNFIYNYIKAFLIKENFCEDILHFLDCHPTQINFNLFFKFFQINNEISILDFENHESYKILINKNLEKFDFFNLMNLKQMLSLNKRMSSRFYFDYFETKINLKKLNSIYIEKLLSNKYNISRSLKEGVDLVNFLLELMKLNVRNDKFWKIAKKAYIKFTHENRINIFEQIFCLCLFSLNSKGNKNFYLSQLNLIQRNLIRDKISMEIKKTEMKKENFELLLNVYINLIFNLRIEHNINVEENSIFRKVLKNYLSSLKENVINYRENYLYEELLFILTADFTNENSSFYNSYYKMIKINNHRLNPSIEDVRKSVDNLKFLYDKVFRFKNFNEDQIMYTLRNYLINLNINILNELLKLRKLHPSAIENKFIILVMSNLINQFRNKKEEFLLTNKNIKTAFDENQNFRSLEKLKFFLIRLHNILKPNNYFDDSKLKQIFLNEAKTIIISHLNNERHLQHLNKLHKELIDYDKQYTETLNDSKIWESYNKSY